MLCVERRRIDPESPGHLSRHLNAPPGTLQWQAVQRLRPQSGWSLDCTDALQGAFSYAVAFPQHPSFHF